MAMAQQQNVDCSKYVGYIPQEKIPVIDPYSMVPARKEARAKSASAPSQRPDHVYNNMDEYFPSTVFSQGSIGCCGSASAVYYMLSHELNAYRRLPGNVDKNQMAAMFTWLTSYQNFDLYEVLAGNGVPDIVTYGGRRDSEIYGGIDCEDCDYGWMQGYDKWYKAMFNRTVCCARFPYDCSTEEGREMTKQWLWNHCGDESFAAGGCVTVGVAFSGSIRRQLTFNSKANIDNGFIGMQYVPELWGETVNHGMAIVGYDDRIEFDLDGDGVCSPEEKGAWVLQNSHDYGYANKGWIYLPYYYHWTTNAQKESIDPVRCYIRKGYEPKYTVRMKMDYSHRSEIYLHAGVAQNVNATKPDYEIDFTHFKYASNYEKKDPAPEVPMLGAWYKSNGEISKKLDYEWRYYAYNNDPMEFGYDLTDLLENVDKSKSYKIFIYVTTKAFDPAKRAAGSGHVYDCTILDYNDKENVKEYSSGVTDSSPMNIATGTGEVTTTITINMEGSGYYPPSNLRIDNGVLKWDAPQNSSGRVRNYIVYKNDKSIGASGSNRSYDLPDQHGLYHVVAVYQNGEKSPESNYVSPEVDSNSVSATFVGDINGTYFDFIRNLVIHGRLSSIDMSEANVALGGKMYAGKYTTVAEEFPAGVFKGCSKLKTIVLPKSISKVGDEAFQNSGITNVMFYEGVTRLGARAFSNCDYLVSVDLPKSVRDIGMDCFSYSSSLKKLYAGTDVASFGQGVFYSNSNQMEVFLYTNNVPITSIYFAYSGGAKVHVYEDMLEKFEASDNWQQNKQNWGMITLVGDLTRLAPPTNIRVEDGVMKWSAPSGGGITSYNVYCNGRRVATVPATQTSYSFDDPHGLFYVTACDALSESTRSAYTTPEIGADKKGVFVGNINEDYLQYIIEKVKDGSLQDVDLSSAEIMPGLHYTNKGIEYVTKRNEFPEAIFNECSYLKRVVMAEGITSVGKSAMAHCDDLVEVVFPSTLTTLAQDAIAYCAKIEKLSFGSAVTKFGQGFCYSNTKRAKVKLYTANVPTSGFYFFDSNGADVHVYPDMVDKFSSSNYWKYDRITIYGDLVKPGAPTNARIDGDELKWDAPTQGDIVFYNIYSNDVKVATVPATVTSFDTTGLHGLCYVKAADMGMESDRSNYTSPDINENTVEAVISGSVNNTYLGYINAMVKTYGKVKVLDMSEANIVTGGENYNEDYNFIVTNNCLPNNFCDKCSSLETVKLPESLVATGLDNFAYCNNISKLYAGSKLTTIGQGLCFDQYAGKRIDAYIPTSVVPTGGDYMFQFNGADIHVLPSMVNAFKSKSTWSNTNYYNIVADIPEELDMNLLKTNDETVSYNVDDVEKVYREKNPYAIVVQKKNGDKDSYLLSNIKKVDWTGYSENAQSLHMEFGNAYVPVEHYLKKAYLTSLTYSKDYPNEDAEIKLNIENNSIPLITRSEVNEITFIPDAPTVILTDAEDYLYNYRLSDMKARYVRNNKAGWNTLTLPFAIRQGSVSGVRFYHLVNVDAAGDGVGKMKIEEYGEGVTIPAYTPMIIYAEAADNLDINEEDANVVFENLPSVIKDGPVGSFYANGTVKALTGDKKLTATSGKSLFYISGNEFHLATKTLSVSPYRAWFESTAANAKGFTIEVYDPESETTNVKAVMDADGRIHEVEGVYDVSGKRRNGMQRGMNIIRRTDGSVVKVVSK